MELHIFPGSGISGQALCREEPEGNAAGPTTGRWRETPTRQLSGRGPGAQGTPVPGTAEPRLSLRSITIKTVTPEFSGDVWFCSGGGGAGRGKQWGDGRHSPPPAPGLRNQVKVHVRPTPRTVSWGVSPSQITTSLDTGANATHPGVPISRLSCVRNGAPQQHVESLLPGCTLPTFSD